MKEQEIIEYFDFQINNGSIYSGIDGKGFYSYLGGSVVGGPFETIGKAREVLFEHLKNRIDLRLEHAEESIKALKEVRERLGNDVFNMGCYKSK